MQHIPLQIGYPLIWTLAAKKKDNPCRRPRPLINKSSWDKKWKQKANFAVMQSSCKTILTVLATFDSLYIYKSAVFKMQARTLFHLCNIPALIVQLSLGELQSTNHHYRRMSIFHRQEKRFSQSQPQVKIIICWNRTTCAIIFIPMNCYHSLFISLKHCTTEIYTVVLKLSYPHLKR